jgi:uncharacterized membrane protein SpoIIM required for sporulation
MDIVFGITGEEEMKRKTNKWQIVSIILLTLIVISILVWTYIKLERENYNKAYNDGVKDGGNYVMQNVATSQTQYGEIWITNGTTIQTIPITTICQNMIDAQQQEVRK